MLTHCRAVAPGAAFVVGRAEAIPFAGNTFDLITAAGSLNYADLDRFLPEAARVLSADGVLVVYDFSAARRFADAPELDAWFDAFETRYPFPPGYALDVQGLPYGRFGLRLDAHEPFEVSLPMTRDAYLRYAMSETNVEQAIGSAAPEHDIRAWCAQTLSAFFAEGRRDIVFTGYVAYVRRS
ncbi:MAG: methyltransferase domain-containing protein, partial [Tepidisphaeraceae bacterium]